MKKIISMLMAMSMLMTIKIPGSASELSNVSQDESVALASSSSDKIPDDALELDGHYYKAYDLSMTWSEAYAYCKRLGGHLATVTSATEQYYISSVISKGLKHYYWLGGTDELAEGQWRWVTGESWTYSNWADDEPNNEPHQGGTENYLTINNVNHPYRPDALLEWNDECNSTFFPLANAGFVCEWEEDNETKLEVYLGSGDQAILLDKDTTIEVVEYSVYPIKVFISVSGIKDDVTGFCKWSGDGITENEVTSDTKAVVFLEGNVRFYESCTLTLKAEYEYEDGEIIESDEYQINVVEHKLNGDRDVLTYAALSSVVYTDFPVSSRYTIDSLLGKNLLKNGNDHISVADESWATFDTFYSATLSGWTVCDAREGKKGFYGALFKSPFGQYVLAFRGTEPTEDRFADLIQDAQLGIGNGALQLEQGVDYYDDLIQAGYPITELTGHSLGGGIANYVSILREVPAVTFNAPSTMVSAINADTEELAKHYRGLNDGLRVDYVNSRDSVGHTGIGDNPKSTETSNTSFVRNLMWGNTDYWGGLIDRTVFVWDQSAQNGLGAVVPYHYFNQLLKYDGESIAIETIGGTNPTSFEFSYDSALKRPHYYALGSTYADILSINDIGYLFAGNGDDDIIITNTHALTNNTIVGGKGNDTIFSANSSKSIYYYNYGDGKDTIRDLCGGDTIRISGYDKEQITFEEKDRDDDGLLFCDIKANGTVIMSVCLSGTGSYTVYLEDTKIGSLQRQNSIVEVSSSHCPVDMNVYDASGNLVQQLQDGVESTVFTEYGVFTVFKEGDEYIKNAVLIDSGYTVEIVGVGDGTMTYSYSYSDENGAIQKFAENIPVVRGAHFDALQAVEEDTLLTGDMDGDGITDCNIEYSVPESISLNASELNIRYTETAVLAAEVFPSEASQQVYWSSSDDSVIYVNADGAITPMGAGTAVITAVSKFDDTVTASCSVTVADEKFPIWNTTISGIAASYKYSEMPIRPEVVIEYDGYTLIEGVDYTVEYVNNEFPGKGKVIFTGMGFFEGWEECYFDIVEHIIYGIVTSYGDSEDDTLIELYSADTDVILSSLTLKGNSTYYCFDNLEPGEYRVRVSKSKHCGEEYYITLSDNVIPINLEIRLIGDISGDGTINNTDVQILQQYFAGWNNTDIVSGALKVADVNCDGSLTRRDAMILSRYVEGWEGYSHDIIHGERDDIYEGSEGELR